jgi:hypothetical protein
LGDALSLDVATEPILIRRHRREAVSAGLAGLCAVGLVAAGFASSSSGATTPSSHTLNGIAKLAGASPVDGAPCVGTGDYADLATGAPVRVLDRDGSVLARGQIDSSKASAAGCAMHFAVSDVPNADIYQVQLGDHALLPYTAADLNDSNWAIDTTVG